MINKVKAYFQSMSDRDRRALFFAAVAVPVILIYLFVALPLYADWSSVRQDLKQYQSRLETMGSGSAASRAKLAGLYQTVPFLELPQDEDQQRKLFWDKSYDQLKKAGIQIKSGPGYVASVRSRNTQGPKTLRLEFSGSCTYEQLLKYLAKINENPYLVSVEELSIEIDDKKPDQVNIEMTLETFIK